MINRYSISFAGQYTTGYDGKVVTVKQNHGFNTSSELEPEDYQNEPYLTMVKDKIRKRIEKRGHSNVIIHSIIVHQFKEKQGRGINKLAKRFLSF